MRILALCFRLPNLTLIWADTSWLQYLDTASISALLFGLLYLLLFFLIRWKFVASLTRCFLLAQIEQVEFRVRAAENAPQQAACLLEEAKRQVQRLNWWEKPGDWFFWSGSRELGAWRLVHEAEIHLADTLSPERARARLDSVASELAEIEEPGAKALASRIKMVLESTSHQPPCCVLEALRQRLVDEKPSLNSGQLKALLHESLRYLDDHRFVYPPRLPRGDEP